MTKEFITIVIPALNEAAYIEKAVRSLLLDDDNYEIIVMDGGSRDGTQAIVARLADEGIPVRCEHNPGRIQSIAMNIAAEIADPRAQHLVRADAHCRYPQGFARGVVDTMVSTGAESVVVPMRTVGTENCFQIANAAAQNSIIGNGGSAHRKSGLVSGWVEHGHHAGFRRDFYLKIGGYDPLFITNQDAEYDVRVIKNGGRIWMERSLEIDYFPRSTALGLARQYYRHGRGRAMTVLKHRMRPKLRQMAPVAAFLGILCSLVMSPLIPFLSIIPAIYVATCLVAGAGLAVRSGETCTYAMGWPTAIMHISWGAGFSVQIGKAVFVNAKGAL